MIAGIRFSGIDLSDAVMCNQTVKLVVVFGLGWAVIQACVFDFTYLYFKMLQYGEASWARKHLGKNGKVWDGFDRGIM
jgi:hypothetical protein